MQITPDFIASWDHSMILIAYACGGMAIAILLYHEFRIFQIKDYKEKYDYVNLHEIRYFWYAVMALILGVAFYANSVGSTMMAPENIQVWFYVRIFITVSFAIIAYFIFYSVVRIYYPRSVEKRLTKLMNKPRISPQGNVMRKLSEEEEEAHLEASQFAEQKEIHSVDYVVWLDEKTGYKKIEKYNSYQHAIECPECGYVTFKIDREEIAQAPDTNEAGILVKHYKCSYCNHREAKEMVIAKLSENAV
jgi:hypothetical protein